MILAMSCHILSFNGLFRYGSFVISYRPSFSCIIEMNFSVNLSENFFISFNLLILAIQNFQIQMMNEYRPCKKIQQPMQKTWHLPIDRYNCRNKKFDQTFKLQYQNISISYIRYVVVIVAHIYPLVIGQCQTLSYLPICTLFITTITSWLEESAPA